MDTVLRTFFTGQFVVEFSTSTLNALGIESMECVVYDRERYLAGKGKGPVVNRIKGSYYSDTNTYPATRKGMIAILKKTHERMILNRVISKPLNRTLGKSLDVNAARKITISMAKRIAGAGEHVPRRGFEIDISSFPELRRDPQFKLMTFTQVYRYACAKISGGNHLEAIAYSNLGEECFA